MRTLSLLLCLSLAACGAAQRPDGEKGLLPQDRDAPALSAVDQRGTTVSLAKERGHFVIVYFYPRDETPGCTKEACAFRDAWTQLSEGGITVIGVSSDDAASHAEFAKKHSLPFSLVPDTDHSWAKAFGVGSTLGMYQRVSFLIDKKGKVARVYPDVDPGIHASQILEDVLKLGQ